MSPDFGLTDENAAYWGPWRFNGYQLIGSARFMFAVAPLKRGFSIQQAQADMNSVADHLAREAPIRDMDRGKPWRGKVKPSVKLFSDL